VNSPIRPAGLPPAIHPASLAQRLTGFDRHHRCIKNDSLFSGLKNLFACVLFCVYPCFSVFGWSDSRLFCNAFALRPTVWRTLKGLIYFDLVGFGWIDREKSRNWESFFAWLREDRSRERTRPEE
jgi:hypothetical protein